MIKHALLAATLFVTACTSSTHYSTKTQKPSLTAAVSASSTGSHRSAEHIVRNMYRRPAETLSFFGLMPDMTVIEVHPGGMWYTEVLAPVLKEKGKLIVAGYDVSVPNQPSYRYRLQKMLEERLTNEKDVFGDVTIATLAHPHTIALGDDASVDMVLTFRSFHGWIRDNQATANLKAFYKVLKPGGTLGVVQHANDEPRKLASGNISGYVSEKALVALAEEAGFVLDARSDINANLKDTGQYPEGVWTLPPTLRLGEKEREKYLAIGESNRMTLRFKKPKKQKAYNKY